MDFCTVPSTMGSCLRCLQAERSNLVRSAHFSTGGEGFVENDYPIPSPWLQGLVQVVRHLLRLTRGVETCEYDGIGAEGSNSGLSFLGL